MRRALPWLLCCLAALAGAQRAWAAPPPKKPGRASCGSIAHCIKLCDRSGQVAACARAGLHYARGRAYQPARAYPLLKRACAAGHLLSCAHLGLLYQDGVGAPWSPRDAIRVYRRACAGGVGLGCYNLYTIYLGGHGVRANRALGERYKLRAKQHWTKECERDANWCTNLAFLEQDRAKRLALMRRACRAGVSIGCINIISPEATAAERMQRCLPLCDRGEPAACVLAAAWILEGEASAVSAGRGVALLKRACRLGDRQGCAMAADELQSGAHVGRDPRAAETFLTQACKRAHAQSCARLAGLHAGRRQLKRAASYLQSACQMGHRRSCGLLARLYASGGRGVPRDEARAVRWATHGCQMGDVSACSMLIARGQPVPAPPGTLDAVYRAACRAGIARACARARQGPGTSSR